MSRRKKPKTKREKMKDKMIIRPKNVSIGHQNNPTHKIHRHKANRRMTTRSQRNRKAISEG